MSAAPLNRRDRRAQRARLRLDADRSAALLARFTLDLAPGAGALPVSDPRAVRALEQGFRHVLRHGGAPHVVRLPEETALAFPSRGGPPPAGWAHYLAVGLDRAGRGTFVLRPIRARAPDAVTARRAIEARMLAELRLHLNDTGPLQAPEGPWRAEAQDTHGGRP